MTTAASAYRTFKPGQPAPTGPNLNTKGWLQEAALRMLLNNLDSNVAENPDELVVYGGRGKAARSMPDFERITQALQEMESDETLLVQSGAVQMRIKTHADAPRVLIANSNLVGNWANWDHFSELEKKGLMMYGQMTAGSWIYIGSQGIVQGTFETFFEAFRQHYKGVSKGKFVFSSGLGGMGGAQPLAATMTGACFLGIEVDRSRAEMRVRTRYLDAIFDNIDDAMKALHAAMQKGEAKSFAIIGNAAEVLPELLKRPDFTPALATDQTSAHDPLYGYVPVGYSMERVKTERKTNPKKVETDAMASIAIHMKALVELKKRGIPTFDYGNNIRAMAKKVGVENAFDVPGFVPEYIRPLFSEGRGPFRFACLSGDPADLKKADDALREVFSSNEGVQRWLSMAPTRISIQGFPSRILWLNYGERARAGLMINEMVRNKVISCPVVIGRDHLDTGSVASPYRETEAMLDGTDAVADWPILNAFGNIASGATWVSFHHGGGVGMGYSLHSGMVIVADGTPEAAKRLERVLSFDPAIGVVRHADAGYDIANQSASKMKAQTVVTPTTPKYYSRHK